MTLAVQTKDVGRVYKLRGPRRKDEAKELTALNCVNLEVEKGELFGIIGPDGAGKTSLFRIIATLLVQDSGKATIDGLDTVKDYKAIRERIGYMPGRFSLYQDLTVEENMNFFATIFNTTTKAKM